MKNNALIYKEKTALKELKGSLNSFLDERLVRFVLYGSRARGDYDSQSDIDVAIIVRGLTRDLKNQILDVVAEVEFKHLVPLSAFVLSEDEFERLKKLERRIALDIESEGIPI
jgi:predicted nucleotidyltransferase